MPRRHCLLPTLRTLALSSRAAGCRAAPAFQCRSQQTAPQPGPGRAGSGTALQDERASSGQAAGTSGRAGEQAGAGALVAVPSGADAHGPLEPGLYLVATPIGNLEDLSFRALRVLRRADAVLAEDTRHSRKLLAHYGIATRPASFHQHNERGREAQVLRLLQAGRAVALISDAGMPLVSDPGEGLVRAVAEAGIRVFPIPGPSAVLAALVASGLPTTPFLFCGFLPPKAGARGDAIRALAGSPATLVFFAPPHSLPRILADLAEHLGPERQCAVARELTKVHEAFHRSPLLAAAQHFAAAPPKGEVTLVVAGAPSATAEPPPPDARELEGHLGELLAGGCSPSVAAKVLARALGLPRNAVYAAALRLKQQQQQQPGPGT